MGLNDVIVFNAGPAPSRISSSGGQSTAFTKEAGTFPSFLRTAVSAVLLPGAAEGRRLRRGAGGGESKRLVAADSGGVLGPGGHLFVRQGTLWHNRSIRRRGHLRTNRFRSQNMSKPQRFLAWYRFRSPTLECSRTEPESRIVQSRTIGSGRKQIGVTKAKCDVDFRLMERESTASNNDWAMATSG